MESGTIEQSLPGLESMTPQPDLDVGRALALAPQKRLMLFSGRSNPDLAQRIAEQLDIELGRREAEDLRERRDLLSVRGLRPRGGHVHRPVRLRSRRSQPDGAADHDQRRAAGIRKADHGRRALVLLRPPGQEVAAARADHGAPRRGHAAVRGCGSCPHDGSPRRAGAGVLPHPRRSHDRDPALRAIRPGPQSRRSRSRPSPRTPGGRSSRASSPR